jgi:hypothetical protein
MILVGHVARMEGIKNTYNISIRKFQAKMTTFCAQVGSHIEMDFIERSYEFVNCIQLVLEQ